jgi:hydrogenase-1 operon protein HyaF
MTLACTENAISLPDDSGQTGMAEAVLREIRAMLDHFAASGESGAIDLSGMPLTRADREALQTRLGRGEVVATLEVAGRSDIWETAYSGVWWVRHWGGDVVASELIEISEIPEILRTDRKDAAAAARRLASSLEERQFGSNGDDS